MCVNCNDTLFNGQNSVIPKPICKNCDEIQVCEDGILATDCIYSIKALPCIGSEAGEQLSSILDKIETYVCSQSPSGNCECPPNTYTINSICQPEGEGHYLISVTPNFTYNYPLTLFATYKLDSDPILSNFQLGRIVATVQSVITSTTIITIFSPVTDNPLNGNLTIQITDNKGNYSDTFSINTDDIPVCT